VVAAGRSRERGAAVFVVVMVITLLAAIGIFAIRAASLATMASGHVREGAQAMHLAEYYTRAAIGELGDPALTAFYVGQLTNNQTEQCSVNKSVVATGVGSPACFKLMDADILRAIRRGFPTQTLLVAQTASEAGSLGPRLTSAGTSAAALESTFAVEMHDAYQEEANLSGMKAGDQTFHSWYITFTTFSEIRSAGSGSATFCPAPNMAATANLHAMRAHVTLPLVPN
jgi:hypothetical protein